MHVLRRALGAALCGAYAPGNGVASATGGIANYVGESSAEGAGGGDMSGGGGGDMGGGGGMGGG